MPIEKKREAYRLGIAAESRAAWALRLKGFRIVARRFKTKAGEVDLIARRGKLILMVEVKARRTLKDAVNSVSYTAWNRIEAAGDQWLAKQKDYGQLSIRFDLVAVLPGKWPIHLENARY
ncbi:MAG: YraN family protein [Pseudomonadota bacterium]